jgi:hypothetical protein
MIGKTSLRAAAIYCLAIWAAVWLLFLLIRISSLDIRIIPGIGPIMLVALAIAVMAPVVAMVLAAAALVRQPRVYPNWLTLGCAIAAFIGEGVLFAATRWL